MSSKTGCFWHQAPGDNNVLQYRGTKIKYSEPRGPEVIPLFCVRIKQTGSGNITDADLSLDYSQKFTKALSSPGSGGSGPRLTPSDGPCFRDQKPTKKIPLHTLDWQSRLYTFLLLHKHMATLPCVFWVHSRSHEQKYSTSLICSSIKKRLLTRTDVVSLIQKTVWDN